MFSRLYLPAVLALDREDTTLVVQEELIHRATCQMQRHDGCRTNVGSNVLCQMGITECPEDSISHNNKRDMH